MKLKKWYSQTELIAMIPDFEQFAEKYQASLPPRPKPVNQVAALKAEVEALKQQLAYPTRVPNSPSRARR